MVTRTIGTSLHTSPVGSARRLGPMVALGVATALVVSACSSAADPTPSPLAEGPSNMSAPQIDRSGVDAAVGQIDGYVEDMMARTGAPGIAVAVVYQDEVVYSKGFGVRKVGEPDPIDTDTMFQLASVSKPVSSSVIAAVVGNGGIAWDDPVKTYEPNFSVVDPYVTDHATFTDLLSHRSGLPDHGGDLLEDLGYNYDDIVARLKQMPLDRFRDNYAYSNYGFTIAGVAAAKSQGMTWAELSKKEIYDPLGMEHTTSSVADWLGSTNHASNHTRVDPDTNTWVANDISNPEAQSPAGGTSSSVADMATWLRMELAGGEFEGEQIVDPDALQFTHRAHAFAHPSATAGARDSFYGTGFNVGTDGQGRVELGHAGAFALGASTNISMLPNEQLGIVVLANTAPIGVAETISAQFMDYAKNGEATVDWVPFVDDQLRQAIEHGLPEIDYNTPLPGAAATRPVANYLGDYSSPFYGAATVVADGENLTLKLGKDEQLSYPLTHYDGDTYSFETSGENAAGPTSAEFGIADGPAPTLTVGYLDTQGLGTFTRAQA